MKRIDHAYLLALAFTFVSSIAYADTSEFERGYHAGLAACPAAPATSIWVCQAHNSVRYGYDSEYVSRTEFGRGDTRVRALDSLMRVCLPSTTHTGCEQAVFNGDYQCKEL